MNKGFTLIELLAVVTLIAILSLLVIPNITENINNKKGEISEANKKILESATDIYIEKNANNYAYTYEANGSTYCIPIQSLITANILETPLKDEQGKEIDYSKIMKATYSYIYNGFEYEIVENSECTEVINYVSKPELENNMIPVIFDETKNAWVKADINSKWYNYSEQQWANAVLVKETKTNNVQDSKSRREYQNASEGTKILEEDILGYFVWIPRFRYQLFSSIEPIEISIVFENLSTPKSRGTQPGEWLTHPAFTYNGIELSGLWISKYEASNKDGSINIKTNQTPWTNIKFDDAYDLASSMVNENNIYGLNNVNTHLIQNNEWSAITYLTNSKYGINEKIASSTENITGESTSTTGNITGIFDMSGISTEYVSLQNEFESSIGYSLNETKSWYGDINSFVTGANSYLTRGKTSIFNYTNATGGQNNNISFRTTLINSATSTQQITRPNIVTTGDGLYVSNLEEGKYIYRGANPNNYIWLDENGDNIKTDTELYRIMSYEKDGTIKVIRTNSIGTLVWDSNTEGEEIRNNEDNTYCAMSSSYDGCNVWANQNNTYLDNKLESVFHYKYYTKSTATTMSIQPVDGTVTSDSTLNKYLNNEWITNTLLEKYLEPHEYYVGSVYYQSTYTGKDKGINMENEEQQTHTWNGKVGLMSVIEYVSASTNQSCTSVYSNYFYNPIYYYDTTPDDGVSNKVQTLTTIDEWPCSNQKYNWLSLGLDEWTITALSANRRSVWYLTQGALSSKYASSENTGVRPAFYLKSSVSFIGEGTQEKPYQIVSY